MQSKREMSEAHPSEARLEGYKRRLVTYYDSYAITIKKLGPTHFATIDSYEKFFEELNSLVGSGDVVYYKEDQWFEKDPKGKIHCHGRILIRRNVYRKKITNIRGFHVKLVLIDDLEGWIAYCRKAQTGKINLKDHYYFKDKCNAASKARKEKRSQKDDSEENTEEE